MVVIGMSMGMMWTFLYIVVEDVAVAWNPGFAHMKLLQGLMLGSAYFLGEVPFFFLSCKKYDGKVYICLRSLP